MGKIQQDIYEPVWKRADYWSKVMGLKTALSAGILALDMITPEQRELAVTLAKGEIPSHTKYEILTPGEQNILKEFRKNVPHLSDDVDDDVKHIVDNAAHGAAAAGKRKTKEGS
jgi:hypothetical protein